MCLYFLKVRWELQIYVCLIGFFIFNFFFNWLLGVYFPCGAGLLRFNFIYPYPIRVDLVQSFSYWTYFIVWIYHISFISFSIQGCSVYFRVFLILKNVAVLSVISFSAKVIFLRNPKHAPGGSNIHVEGFMVGPCTVSSLELCFLVIFLIQISTPIELFKFGFWEGVSEIPFLSFPTHCLGQKLDSCGVFGPGGGDQPLGHGCASFSILLASGPRP